MTQVFHAHSTSSPDESDWQTLPDHLNAVGKLAGQSARHFGAAVLAETAGKLHDLGKYTDAYQQRIRGGPCVDHATWGAKVACERYGALGRMLAYGIAGHHAGMANGCNPGTRTPLDGRLAADLPVLFNDYMKDLTLPAAKEMEPTAWRPNKERLQFQLSLLTRMIFSCVVDGDYLDTDRFYSRTENRPFNRDTPKPTLIELRAKLDTYLSAFKVVNPIDATRAQILTHARSHANDRIGMFSLTVPTGGGKTLTSLAFALDHAIAHGLDRVIFLIPFTSVVEQNAAVFKKAFGNLGDAAVLEHHSAFVPTPGNDAEAAAKLRVLMDNWDAPVIVTTSVRRNCGFQIRSYRSTVSNDRQHTNAGDHSRRRRMQSLAERPRTHGKLWRHSAQASAVSHSDFAWTVQRACQERRHTASCRIQIRHTVHAIDHHGYVQRPFLFSA
ncbi:CRISPR-associated endonuclease Cas3'' [Caballeronia sp. DA-9]|uniref:CRISPR-associated endonuclease Cas3'' n=1 Tax=Caballeronia sp. DA-9 TaxID=3436237 RepID=UPI003F66F565